MSSLVTPRNAAIRWIARNHFSDPTEATPVADLAETLRRMARHLEWLARKVESTADVPFKVDVP